MASFEEKTPANVQFGSFYIYGRGREFHVLKAHLVIYFSGPLNCGFVLLCLRKGESSNF